MASEQLSLAATPDPVDGQIDAINGTINEDDVSKAPRLPRWTRQEILVLIQGKRAAENRVRRGRATGLAFGSGQVEPKWASVSSYCKRHGVIRGPVQCRKRWSNLAGDFKKIKEWENNVSEESESFWVMRNDLRREKKLPGFFDREVYDILHGFAASSATEIPDSVMAPTLALALTPTPAVRDVAEEDAETVFDSRRSAGAEDGLFSDFEQVAGARSPVKVEPVIAADAGRAVPAPIPISGTTKEKHPTSNPEVGSSSQEARKRKRMAGDGDEETSSPQFHLSDVLEKNGKMLVAQLEAQNTNFQQDREQRKDHSDNLVTVLNKLADALGRIADKL